MKEVRKVWGKEVILVNNDDYCGKLLYLDKGAISSFHAHPVKKESFYILSGSVALFIEDEEYTLSSLTEPKTILPGEKHSFRGIEKALMLEISTHDNPEDCVRFSTSQPGET